MLLALMMTGLPGASAAERMPAAQQTSLVQKYCAVCHTDATKNGGLSLQHYDASRPDPQLAAMLLSKLRNGAMGAAGLGIPDPVTRGAWVATTVEQAAGASRWNTIRSDAHGSKDAIVVASIVREVAARAGSTDLPVYRLALTCKPTSREGEIQLTWSPAPQTGRTFYVSADGEAGIPQRLDGREDKMGNGAALSTGLASTKLNTPLPGTTLTIRDLFPGETVVFPVGELGQEDRRQLAVCLAR